MKLFRQAIGFLILIACFVTISKQSLGQDATHVDSLRHIIDNTEDDTLRVRALLKLSDIYRRKQPDKHLSIALQAVNLANKIAYRYGIALGYSSLGKYNFDIGDYKQSIKYYSESYQLFSKDSIKKIWRHLR